MLSHHPLCQNFKNEVIEIRRIFVCRGCTFFYMSFVITFVILFANTTIFSVEPLYLFILVNILAFPSFFGSYMKSKNRLIKDVYRIFLGMAVAFPLTAVILISSLVVKALIVIFITLYFFSFKIIRQKTHIVDLLCEECENFTDNACINYRRVFKSQRDHSRVISDYLQKKLVKSNYIPFFDPNEE